VNTVDPSIYTARLDADSPAVVLRFGQIWPTSVLSPSRPINVRFTAGYPSMAGTASASTTTVTRVSGDSFAPGMKRIVIDGACYRVVSVASGNVLTVGTSPPIQGTKSYSANLVPERLVQAILMLTGHWYQNREEVVVGRTSTIATDVPDSVSALIRRFKIDSYTPDPLRR
jgi:hypothetical protein